MEILTTIKRLSENYKVPIEIFGYIHFNELTSDDYICDGIAKSVEKVLGGNLK